MLSTLCSMVLVLLTPAAVQDAPDPARIERSEAWPAEPGGLSRELARLRKAGSAVMATDAEAALVEMGAGAVPRLVLAYAKERDETARERVRVVLERLVDARHTRLLAREFQHDSARVRLWALEVVARHPDSGVREPARAALVRARTAREDAREKGRELPARERDEALRAALACLSAGSLAGLEELCLAARSEWSRHGVAIRHASRAARGAQASAALLPGLRSEDHDERLVALRLLAGLGDESSRTAVAAFLDGSDNVLRIAAINALRGIVDGEPPLERLSALQAIEVAQRWKERL